MERKIGEIFKFGGEWYQCVEADGCFFCDFYELINCSGLLDIRGECVNKLRSDGKPVVFKKLEKFGEPLKINGKIYQGLISPYGFNNCSMCAFRNISCKDVISCYDDYIFIETKQTKEDMEEKNNGNTPLNVLTDKYVNGDICYDDFEKEVKALYSCKEEIKPTLKDFDLEAAKQGKPVYTRDGRKARIVCYDFKGGDYPIIALVECRGNREIFCAYSEKGEIGIGTKTDEDLMIAPELHEGWVNIYRDADTGRIWASQIYKTELAAMEFAPKAKGYITAVKIEWEE